MRPNDIEEGSISFDSEELGEETFPTILKQLEILTKLGYECLFYYEDCGIYVLRFAYHNADFATGNFQFITNEEWENICYQRNNGDNTDEN